MLLGILAGNLGLADRAPLFQSDSYGLLLLSLMGLMANNLANTQPQRLLSMAGPVLLALAVGSAVLLACGWFLAKALRLSPYVGVILTMNSIMGFPVNRQLTAEAVDRAPEHLRGALTAKLSPLLGMSTMLVSNCLSVFIVSILVALV